MTSNTTLPTAPQAGLLVQVGPMSFIKSISRVTFEQDQLEEARYWASKSLAERVEAGWSLAEDNLFTRKQDHEPEKRTTITFLSIERGRR